MYYNSNVEVIVLLDIVQGVDMFTDSILVKILVGIIWGAVLGIISVPLSKKLTLNRTDDPVKAAPLNKPIFKILAVVVGMVASVGLVLTADDTYELIRNMLLLIPIFSIAIVDSLIRKIPNSLLLAMIIFQAVYCTYYSIVNHTTRNLIMAAFGFFVGFAACTVPSILKIPVGSGDIKYSAVIGLCVYFAGYLEAMVLMGLLAVVCLAYLKISKKGGLKTMIPMGPLISIGTVITMCFPFVEKIIGKAAL